MKYFFDTEFIEGSQDKTFMGIKYGKTKPTIDLISIGIVAEDGREYYAISKDFNLKEAWNRFDLKPDIDSGGMKKVYWIRDNVLKPIEIDLFKLHCKAGVGHKHIAGRGDYKAFKWLLETYGKTNKQIADDIVAFCKGNDGTIHSYKSRYPKVRTNPEFYAYCAYYDWVVFCWLFGKMIDLPTGFPKYCIDLKQELHDKVDKLIFSKRVKFDIVSSTNNILSLKEKLTKVKKHPDYPKQINEHNALDDARWNKELYIFLNSF